MGTTPPDAESRRADRFGAESLPTDADTGQTRTGHNCPTAQPRCRLTRCSVRAAAPVRHGPAGPLPTRPSQRSDRCLRADTGQRGRRTADTRERSAWRQIFGPFADGRVWTFLSTDPFAGHRVVYFPLCDGLSPQPGGCGCSSSAFSCSAGARLVRGLACWKGGSS